MIEQGEAEVMVRSEGYLRTREDFERIPVVTGNGGIPVLLQDVAGVRRGPTLRRGIAELDGEGEVVGGVVILRSGKNALAAIDAVKARLQKVQFEVTLAAGEDEGILEALAAFATGAPSQP